MIKQHNPIATYRGTLANPIRIVPADIYNPYGIKDLVLVGVTITITFALAYGMLALLVPMWS
jgi:hypothetical protein